MVDASNVAHFGRKTEDKPSLDYIIKAADALEKMGYEPILIADASLKIHYFLQKYISIKLSIAQFVQVVWFSCLLPCASASKTAQIVVFGARTV